MAALREIQDRGLLEDRDVVLYDVLGDVVCGGFSMPLREAIADDVYLVTTSDFMAVYAANNICRGVKKYAESGGVRLSGVVYNGRSGRDDPSVALRFARLVGTELAGEIPMSPLIGRAELERRTVLEAYPDSPVSQSFRALASHMYARGAAASLPRSPTRRWSPCAGADRSGGGAPCFSGGAHRRFGRIHLPVAPRCNLQCAYCDRRYDCPNESRPGVTSSLLTPKDAVQRTALALAREPRIRVAGVAGPGEPLDNPETYETFRLLHRRFPALTLCVSTNGLLLPDRVEALTDCGVRTLTITINAVHPGPAAALYSSVRWRGHRPASRRRRSPSPVQAARGSGTRGPGRFHRKGEYRFGPRRQSG